MRWTKWIEKLNGRNAEHKRKQTIENEKNEMNKWTKKLNARNT